MAEREVKELATLPQGTTELSIQQAKRQAEKIQKLVRSVMKESVHYGSVPGVDNKFLYKAGAEKLCLVFRLIPQYKIDKTVHEGGHITYEITCSLVHQPTGSFMGQGVGSCSTLEKKYRWRNDDTGTGVELPSAWWNSRKMENLPKILKNSGVTPLTPSEMKKKGLELAPGKVNGKWEVVYRKKVENKDVADVYNTVIKMAKKRALVDATITALAVSDMFVQDPSAVGDIDPDEEQQSNASEKEAKQNKGTAARGSSSSGARTNSSARRSSEKGKR